MRDARGSPAIGSGPRRVRVGRPYQTLQENESPTSFERGLATVIELLPKGTLPKGISHTHAAHLRVGAIRGITKTCRSSKDLRKEIAQCRFDQEWRAHEIQHIRLCFPAPVLFGRIGEPSSGRVTNPVGLQYSRPWSGGLITRSAFRSTGMDLSAVTKFQTFKRSGASHPLVSQDQGEPVQAPRG